MGKNIVRRKHPDEPNKHSHLWIDEEIEDILANDTGTEATRCLKLKTSRGHSRILMKGLGKMKKLRYLELNLALNDVECLDDTCEYFPNSLKYLKCLDYPFLCLPKTFQANNLVRLEMESCRTMVQLCEEKVLKQLEFHSLSESNLANFDFKMTPNLKTLILEKYYLLTQLCMPVTCQKLNHLKITSSKLTSFDLRMTPNLEGLDLDDSPNLAQLFMPISCQKLSYLSITSSKLTAFDLRLTPNLETLDLYNCADFETLQVSAPCTNLKFLNLLG